MSEITDAELAKMDSARFMLEPPAPDVVGSLIAALRQAREEAGMPWKTLHGQAIVDMMKVQDALAAKNAALGEIECVSLTMCTASPEDIVRKISMIAAANHTQEDQLVDTMAAGAWQDGPAPKDGSWILGLFHGLPYVVGYDSWEVGGEMLSDGTGSPPDGHESGWCLAGDNLQVMDQDEPEKWARIIHPNRHMPASWDGPGDRS